MGRVEEAETERFIGGRERLGGLEDATARQRWRPGWQRRRGKERVRGEEGEEERVEGRREEGMADSM